MSCKISSIALGFFICFNLHASILLPLPELGAKSTETAVNTTKLNEFSLRHRMMSYDPNYLFAQGKAAEKQVSAVIQKSIRLDLFGDKVIYARAVRTYARPDGKTVWVGQVVGDINSTVNLIADNTELTANIRSKGQLFQIRTQTNGNPLVNEFFTPKKLSTDVVSPPAAKQKPSAKSTDNPSFNRSVNTELPIYSGVHEGFTNSADVSVLVYYTHQALESIPDLLNAIDLDFIDTNQAFANSGVQASVSIAAKIAVDESPISGGLAFDELTEKKEPFTNIDEVRAKYQADLVHFYPQRLKNACGLAYYAAFPNGWAEREFGFGATAAYCTGNLNTAHELGHNFGAAHDRYVEDGGTDYANYGYIDLDNQFQTIMSYSDECNDNDVNCSKITYFSTPDKTYNEFPTGLAEPISEATNNAAQLNYSALTLANFLA